MKGIPDPDVLSPSTATMTAVRAPPTSARCARCGTPSMRKMRRCMVRRATWSSVAAMKVQPAARAALDALSIDDTGSKGGGAIGKGTGGR